jgi:hypothetical protein
LGGNQDQTRLRSETSADDEVKRITEKGPEEVATKQNKAQGEEIEIIAEAVDSSRQQPNRTVRFGKPDHPVSPAPRQKKALNAIVPKTAPSPHWCPSGLTPS